MDVLGGLKSFVVRVKSLTVDDGVFRLHYRFTFMILLGFSILVTSRQYIGDPIDCYSTNTIRADMIDQYCWVSSTHTMPNACHKKVGDHVIAPCVDRRIEGDEVVTHQYYQWVCFVLFLQALMFYFPHYMWKCWEGGRLKALTMDLEGPLVSEDVKQKRIDALKAYFNVSLHRHNFYAIRYTVCELLNFVNIVGQMFLTNHFLGGTFLDYGTDVVNFSQLEQSNRTDPMSIVFPRVTKCAFHTFGPSGDVQKHDAVCVLPINIINEKIYIVLWFWFVVLAVVTGMAVVYRLVTIFSGYLRYRLLRSKATSVPDAVVETISSRLAFGDWFLLFLLSKNINSYIFKDVADVVAKQLDGYDDSPDSKALYKKKFPL